ncbi:dTDP-4-amino-4,6-dideoxy-D-glucose transaminase [Sphaerisporangium rufum]|uniref:dTDP-4-amino-4,6-dideoxy-D-glucose transaminase n=2 Tax=Sphaerisporangium rufum TaxID=1381558 RepID=A0A919R5K2_9ACTN|nr:dTDP-4-amino-4,6-dideoxy-D-glucose transaminase [Sphaerisporangium rufum]
MTQIPFHRPYVARDQLAYVTDAMHRPWTSGYGHYGERAVHLLREVTGAPHIVLTTSGTTAMDLAALAFDPRPGDEVIVPSFTFVATANAFVLRGAVPVFVDSRPDTLNMDEDRIEAAITGRTRAIAVVHYAGVACEMDRIMKIAERHDLAVIEDNAHGLGGTYHGRALGSYGLLAAQSFHATKNIQCGEGGAVLTADAGLAERAEILHDKGTNRRQFFRGQVDMYRWVDLGTAFAPSEILAAQLVAQLESYDLIQSQRRSLWLRYHEELADWAAAQGVARPGVPDGCEHPAHIYYLLLPDLANRQELIAHLRARGIQAIFHYSPLHSSPAGQRFGRTAPGGCPVAESAADRLIRLPLYAGLEDDAQSRVIEAVKTFRVT